MTYSSGISPRSYWRQDFKLQRRQQQPLSKNLRTEVVVIGAGITGLSIALYLKKAGKTVTVLEAQTIGGGTTGGTSGHLEAGPDQGIKKFIHDFGESAARQITEGRLRAIDQIEAWVKEHNIQSDFQRIQAYHFSESSKGAADLRALDEAARRIALPAHNVAHIPLPFPCAGGLVLENQARFHSMKYLDGLAEAFFDQSCHIYEHTTALPPEDGDPCTVTTSNGAQVKADQVVLATHSAFLGISQLDMRLAPYQSYVIAAEVEEEIPDALFWDDAEPYHYIRRARGEDPHLLIIGGIDHKTGQSEDERGHVHALESYTRERFSVRSISQKWSSEYFEPADGVPYIGRVPGMDNVYIAAGFLGTGLTYGTLAAEILRSLIMNQEHPLADIVTPSRLSLLVEAPTLISENANVTRHFITDRLGIEAIESLDEIAPNEGRLIRYAGERHAAYRDHSGKLHLLSPVCTHAGCFVQWNPLEKTWDCPCHGGRYSATGERIYGPPPRPLKPSKTSVPEA